MKLRSADSVLSFVKRVSPASPGWCPDVADTPKSARALEMAHSVKSCTHV